MLESMQVATWLIYVFLTVLSDIATSFNINQGMVFSLGQSAGLEFRSVLALSLRQSKLLWRGLTGI